MYNYIQYIYIYIIYIYNIYYIYIYIYIYNINNNNNNNIPLIEYVTVRWQKTRKTAKNAIYIT